MSARDETEARARLLKRWEKLKGERSSWDAHWKELSRYMLPRRGRFTGAERNDGRKRHSALVNNTPLIAARNLAAGMTGGLTSPARPWFRLALADPRLSERAPVKAWLEAVGGVMRDVMARSNLYNCLATSYAELGVFGTAALGIAEDPRDGLRATAFTAGEYAISVGSRQTADAVFRESEMTVGQVVRLFGRDRCSNRVKTSWDRGDYDNVVCVLHAVEENHEAELSPERSAKPFISRYLEVGTDSGGFLSVGGFEEMPILCPRWNVASADVYGSSPGMDALGDSVALQTLEKKRAQALEKLINPPMVADPSLKNQPATVLPGGVTYASAAAGRPAFTPAYQINPPLGEIRIEILAHEARIRRAFYEDLFLMLAASDRRHMTAREVEERHEEKLLMLGPVLERLHDELLDPLVNRVFSILRRNSWLPEPPPELAGTELKVEYTSVLASAQKAVAVGSMEEFTGFVGRVATLSPTVLDTVDWDAVIAKNADAVGLGPGVLRDPETVGQLRSERGRAAREAATPAASQTDGAEAGS